MIYAFVRMFIGLLTVVAIVGGLLGFPEITTAALVVFLAFFVVVVVVDEMLDWFDGGESP